MTTASGRLSQEKMPFFTLARCRIWTRRFRTRRQRAKARRLLDSGWFGLLSHARSQGTAFSSGSIEGRRRLYSRTQVRLHASSVGAKRHPSRDDRKKCWGKSRRLIDTVVDKSRVSREPMCCDGPRRVLPASCGGPGQSWLEYNAGSPRVRSPQPSPAIPSSNVWAPGLTRQTNGRGWIAHAAFPSDNRQNKRGFRHSRLVSLYPVVMGYGIMAYCPKMVNALLIAALGLRRLLPLVH